VDGARGPAVGPSPHSRLFTPQESALELLAAGSWLRQTATAHAVATCKRSRGTLRWGSKKPLHVAGAAGADARRQSPCRGRGRPWPATGRLVVQYSVRSVQVRRLYEPSMLPHTSPPGAVMSCPAGRHGRRDDVFRFVFGVACCAVPGAFPGRETRHQNVTGGPNTVADWLDRGGIIHPCPYHVNTRFPASR
jgi:hypothetical protein